MITGMMSSPRRFGWLGMAFSRQVTGADKARALSI